MKMLTITNPPVCDYAGKESVNTICTNIIYAGKHLKKLLFTSCVANEGKSTMTMRIAESMAARGYRCVVVDCDFRASVMIKEFKIRGEGSIKGITRYLAGRCEMNEICYATNIDNLCIVPVDKTVSTSLTLIHSEEFSNLLGYLEENFDYVFLDTPPVGIVIDAADIAGYCDGSVLVIEYGKRHRGEVLDAVNQLKRTGTPIIGCIIDKITLKTAGEKRSYKGHYGYGYGYGKGYGKGYGRKDAEK